MSAALQPWIGLAGPTAAGKSALALALAERLAQRGQAAEIVSVDSALVYRGMDIGTAKPSAAERAAVPHHLIDLIDPTEAYSAARFVQDATALIAAIRARGALPLLVGGTMLYFKALIDGLDAMPAADAALRLQLEERARTEGWPALHAELARVDPSTAARLPPHDAQRIQRALEVYLSSGVPLSQWHTRGEGQVNAPAVRNLLLSIEAPTRSWLHQRIGERFAAMLDAGLLDEVRALRARGDLQPTLPSMRCVGYRQAWAMLDGEFPPAELAERGAAATRQLAKRQMTWLRSLPQRTVIEATDAAAADRAMTAIDAFEAGGAAS